MVMPNMKEVLLFIGGRVINYFFFVLFGVALGYLWAMKAYSVGLFQ